MNKGAFNNAYEYALEVVLRTCPLKEEGVTKRTILLEAEQALRDWDGSVGPRWTDYKPKQYELTDKQWYDCQTAV